MSSAVMLFERFGRRIAMDLGFGAFLEKIEEHFGRGVLKVLLFLIGLAVALVCSKLIWDIALGPFVTFITGAFAGGTLVEEPLRLFVYGAGIASGLLLTDRLAKLNNRIVRERIRSEDALIAAIKDRMERDPEARDSEQVKDALKVLEQSGRSPMDAPSPAKKV